MKLHLPKTLDRRIKQLMFWIVIGAVTVVVVCTVYKDILKDTLPCPKVNSHTQTAWLTLDKLDLGKKQITGKLSVPLFNSSGDTLVLSEFETDGPNSYQMEEIFKVDPNPQVNEAAAHKNIWEVALPYHSYQFLYPFESYTLNLQFHLKKDGSPDAIPMNLRVLNRMSDPVVLRSCEFVDSSTGTIIGLDRFNIVLSRLYFLIIITAILYLMAVAFLVYIGTRASADNVLANSLGYLVALWGVRGIILGSTTIFPTIVDFLTISLYVAVVAIISYKLLFKWKGLSRLRKRKAGQHALS